MYDGQLLGLNKLLYFTQDGDHFSAVLQFGFSMVNRLLVYIYVG